MRHYHVLVGLSGGYMPNQNLGPFLNKKDAESSAAEIAGIFRDQGLYVSGSARAGYYQVADCEYIEITRCFEMECLMDEPEYLEDNEEEWGDV